jgi:Cu(I)/Ag(I) efflux system periplasmic protein CusF
MIQWMRTKLAITALTGLTCMPLLATDMTDGEVRKIDLEQAKVTLRHQEIKDLDMPPMTMVFVVKDRAQLAKLKPGDKVKFRAINEAGKFTVTEIQALP